MLVISACLYQLELFLSYVFTVNFASDFCLKIREKSHFLTIFTILYFTGIFFNYAKFPHHTCHVLHSYATDDNMQNQDKFHSFLFDLLMIS